MADLDGMNRAARKAYAAAQELIEEVVQRGGTEIRFVREAFRELTQIPPEVADIKGLIALDLNWTKVSDLSPIRDLTGLQTLNLNQTEVSDLSPIRDLTGLQYLSVYQTPLSDLSPIHDLTSLQNLLINRTGVSDLSPIRYLTALRYLNLSQTGVSDLYPIHLLTKLSFLILDRTRVSDLRPLVGMKYLGISSVDGLWFSDTPAVEMDEKLARLAEIRDSQQRAKETLAYLKTLPPWPEPLPWLTKNDSPPPQAPNPPPRPAQTRPDPPLTRATAGPKTPAKHLKFLLSQPRLTAFTAKEVAGQIRWALKDVKRATNSLPEPLATIEEIADALNELGDTSLGPKDKQRVEDLQLRIAQLEALVEKLTAQLSDSEKARETAEALAKSQGFQANFSPKMAEETAKSIGFFARTGFFGGMIYFLGPTGPTITALLTAIELVK